MAKRGSFSYDRSLWLKNDRNCADFLRRDGDVRFGDLITSMIR